VLYINRTAKQMATGWARFGFKFWLCQCERVVSAIE